MKVIRRLETDLVASHAVLFHLLEFALKLRLSLHFFLGTADVDQLAVQLLPVHLIHRLQQNKKTQSAQAQEVVDHLQAVTRNSYLLGVLVPLKADKPEASRLSVVIRHDTNTHGIS